MTYRPTTGSDRPRRRGLLPADGQFGWMPYLWLVYALIFLFEPLMRLRFGALTPGYAAATVVGLVVFLASYFRGFRVSGARLLPVIGVQCLLGAGFAPFNSGSAVFFVYAASFAGMLDPARHARYLIHAIAGLGALTAWILQLGGWFWIPATVMALVVGFANLQQAQTDRANARLRLAHEQIEHLAAVAERERIARDLHDVLGHSLSLIVLKSELAAKLSPHDAERAGREIRDVEQVARKALREVREAIRGYRASLADEVEQSGSLLTLAGIDARIEVEPLELERAVEFTLALALREAVTNVVRHSHALRCDVRLYTDAGTCVLVVEDDGRAVTVREGSGLRGMRERVESLNGSIGRGAGSGGRGLRLEVRVPLTPGVAPEDRREPAAVPG
jgi:two-component system, NarL family, sensor histidine kinase DesK